MRQSLFARVTRYPPSPAINPRENRLTEVTAAVLERVDGLAHRIVIALLAHAATVASEAAKRVDAADAHLTAMMTLEADRLSEVLTATRKLHQPRVQLSTQVATTKGRFVDLEVWLKPRDPSATTEGVLVWVEAKHGSGIHGDQLDVYLEDIKARPATHRVVLLLAPRRQELSAPPMQVARVDWQTVAGTVAEMLRRERKPTIQMWLLTEYAAYLREEGLMAPNALTASHAISLMEWDDADAALAGICEHAETWVSSHWDKPRHWATPRGASTDHAFGSEYWATYRPNLVAEKPPTWLGAWFDWGVGYTSMWQYLDPGTVRGSVAMWAGVGFETKGQPQKVEGNEEWLAQRLNDEFVACWFLDYHRLVRIRYPDELLVATTLEEQGRELGRWVVSAFEALAANVPPH